MLNLTDDKYSDGKDDKWLDLATSSRMDKVQELIDLKDRLEERYKDYDGIIEDYLTQPLDSEFTDSKDLLKNTYGSPPTDLKKKITALRHNHGFLQCAFCGRPVKTRILDHFIPKEKWPEFSIYPNNLVQQCDSCSSIKWQHYYCNEDSIVKYIHPKYFDLLSRVNISINIDIKDKLNLNNAILKPKFKVTGETTDIEKTRIKAHIKNLKISSEIESYVYTKYNDIINEARKKKTNYNVLLTELVNQLSRHDVNSNWEVALYKAMLEENNIVTFFDINKPTFNVIDIEEPEGEYIFI
ncbi:hypothetical protein NOK74_05055 [Vibrio parahaemolyticus]|uniref:hypothetical protein n=1 Tax=Vibrio parahaemolyticus TaxID=670 RepID=UPI00226A4B7C|nr:hypothetical protein [Vibrio parahaemolyticus]MCX8871547.1 hypothetical protein [Vibrio parahaemolyticus]